MTIVLVSMLGTGVVVATAEPNFHEATAVASVSVPPGGFDGNPEYTADVSRQLLAAKTAEYAALASTAATAAAVGQVLELQYSPAQLLRAITISAADDGLLTVRARASTPGGAARLANTWVEVLEGQVVALARGVKAHRTANVTITLISSATP